MDFPEPDMIAVNGITLGVYRMGPESSETDKPPVVLMHGFPELAYSWRYQMRALADAGYPVFAPDMRGYGVSDKPEGIAAYTMDELTRDMAGIVAHYDLGRAVFVGHDWGALVLWSLPFYQSDILLGLAGLNVAFMPNYPMDPIELFRSAYGDDMYMVRFQEEGVCDAILDADTAKSMRFFLRRAKKAPSRTGEAKKLPRRPNLDLVNMFETVDESAWFGENWLSDADMKIYSDAFAAGGFTAPINWYRNFTSNWEKMKEFQPAGTVPSIDVPSLMITADMDAACPPRLADGMETYIKNYRRLDLKGISHWSQQEAYKEINETLLSWLGDNWG